MIVPSLLEPMLLPKFAQAVTEGLNWLAEKTSDSVTVSYNRAPGSQEDLSGYNIQAQYTSYLLNHGQYIISGERPPIVSYLQPYETELNSLFNNLTASTLDQAKKAKIEENSQRIIDLLGRCAARIKDENHNFVILVMALILIESRFNPQAKSPFGAHGIMQVKIETAAEQLLKMDLGTLFALGLQPEGPLFKAVIDMKLKNRACTQQQTTAGVRKAKAEYQAAQANVTALIINKQLIYNETFNTGVGIYYLSSLIEDFKETVGPQKGKITEQVIEKAVYSYNGGKQRVINALKYFQAYRGAQADFSSNQVSLQNVINAICDQANRGPSCKAGGQKYDPLENNPSQLNPQNWTFLSQANKKQAADSFRPLFALLSIVDRGGNTTGFKGYQHYWDFLPSETQNYQPKLLAAFRQAKRYPSHFTQEIHSQ